MMRGIFFLFFTLLLIGTAISSEKMVEFRPHLFKNNQDYFLALEYKHYNGWHTYFKNPGDSGEPTRFAFFIKDKEIKLEEPLWPFPKTFKYGSVNTYGYDNDFVLFVKISSSYFGKKLKIQTTWLGCKNLCVPGKAEATLDINQKSFVEDTKLKSYFDNLPTIIETPVDLVINLIRDEKAKKIQLYYSFKELLSEAITSDQNLLVPVSTNDFGLGMEKLSTENNLHLSGEMEGVFDGIYLDPPKTFPTLNDFQTKLSFTFQYINPNNRKTYQFNHTFVAANDLVNTPPPETTNEKKALAFWHYLLLAFVGGILLNLMPCVLPVISLKLFGLIKQKNQTVRNIFIHNLSYTLGILFSFIILATLINLIKLSGDQVGWGFQLQSPTFVGIMAFFIFIFSLNLFGLFEFITPGGKILGNFSLGKGFLSDFMGGILSVILSTPCSAPFLGTALTFAFTTTPFNIYLVFLVIGLGLSSPFLLTAVFPSTLFLLPRPGEWMNIFKKFLGLSLLITSAWLISILFSLTKPNVLYFTLLPSLFFIFLSFLFKKRLEFLKIILVAISSLLLISYITLNQLHRDSSKQQSLILLQAKRSSGLNFSLWHSDIKYPRDQISFIDFTASWCLTCKVNEKIILNTPAFKELVTQYNLNLLLADWTSGNEDITKWLKDHGYAGVPAYFIVSKNQKFYDLGETITINEIENNIKKALDE